MKKFALQNTVTLSLAPKNYTIILSNNSFAPTQNKKMGVFKISKRCNSSMSNSKKTLWQPFEYKIQETSVLNNQMIQSFIEKFWDEKASRFNDGEQFFIQFKASFKNTGFRSLAIVQLLDKNGKLDYCDYLAGVWEVKDEDYKNLHLKSLKFEFKLLDNKQSKNKKPNEIKRLEFEKKEDFNYMHIGHSLPVTMDWTQWGSYSVKNKDYSFVKVEKKNSNLFYEINIFDNHHNVSLKTKLGKEVLSFTDTLSTTDRNNLNTFTRKFKNHEHFFVNSEIVFKKVYKTSKFMSSIKKNKNMNNRMITFDVETYDKDGFKLPYCVCIFDGNIKKSYYLTDYSNSEELVKEALWSLIDKKYNGFKVYLHNFSKFDGVFMLRVIAELAVINKTILKPIINEGNLINIELPFGYNQEKKRYNYKISFRDSRLLLPSSLKNLSKNFNVSNKDLFPVTFPSEERVLNNYVGEVPDYNYFPNLTWKSDYIGYRNSFNGAANWNLKEETIKYCLQDCISLYEVLTTFNKLIFELYHISVTKYSTLSSLANAIYFSNFYRDDYQIPIVNHNRMFKYLKRGYTGGAVDVFKPQLPKNKKLHRYDVNSLYPSTMTENTMPTGNCYYFEGDIFKIFPNENIQGIFEAEIVAPYMHVPILQIRISTSTGSRTIAPVGKWTGVYESRELLNALKYGYKIKVKSGYVFEKYQIIFKEYVESLFCIKKNNKKGTPLFIISKLLLNTLYGRFGMSPEKPSHLIVSSDDLDSYLLEKKVVEHIDLNNNTVLISYFENKDDYADEESTLNVSIPIALTVTALARVKMSFFKNLPGYTLYYSDTDSADFDEPLPGEFVGPELGQMKLEGVYDSAIYIAPKVYSLKNNTEEISVIKGLTMNVPHDTFKELLMENNVVQFHQEKWKRDLGEGTIKVQDMLHSLKITSNKRKIIYENGIFTRTEPLVLNEVDSVKEPEQE